MRKTGLFCPANRKALMAAIAVVCGFVASLPVRADHREHRATVRDVGPEDGILCCLGREPFLFDGDGVLAITGRAGVFRSTHRGQRWDRSMQGLVGPNGVSPFVNARCQAPSQPRIVHVLAESSSFSGIFSSRDFGETWTRRAPLPINYSVVSCAIDAADPRTVYVSTVDVDFVSQLWESTDGGNTFQRVGTALPPSFGITFIWTVPGTVYVFTDTLYASTDGAASFRMVPRPAGGAAFVGWEVSSDGRAIFARTADERFQPTGVFRSIDGGSSYQRVTGLLSFDGLLALDAAHPQRVYASDGLLHVSNDGGLTFELVPASNDPRFLGPIRQISVDRRGSVYLDTIAGPFRTDDGGRTFHSLLDGFRASSVEDLAVDANGNVLVGVLHTQSLFKETHGLGFRPIGSTPGIFVDGSTNDGMVVAASPGDPNVILLGTGGQGLFRTDDGGRHWTAAEVPDNPASYNHARMVFATSSRVFVAAPVQFPPQRFFSGLYRSDDAGQTFARLSSLPFGAIAVDPADPDVVYLGTSDTTEGLFKSTDGGRTIRSLGQPGAFSSLVVDRHDPRVIYAGERFGRVLRSVDGGKRFKPAIAGLAGAGVHGIVQDSRGTLFAWLRGGGLFASDDAAATWEPVETDETLERSGVAFGRGTLVADPRRPGRLYVGNAGVLRIDVEDR
jgi:photosystem II stability/assembly factor-like uncharacterized protein